MQMSTALNTRSRSIVGCLILFSSLSLATNKNSARPKSYELSTWTNLTCRAKGRFQDRDYCQSVVMDQIVADGKSAIPVLISQITDTRWVAEPVYDFWPRIRTGELAYLILGNLFVDETWQKNTMPPLFPQKPCHESGWDCWAKFRKAHTLKDLQSHWLAFWKANKERVFWDDKARCFRLVDRKMKK